ncbi:uncharacterized protein LOC112682535 isoform X2 [Sipha flava]|uniref:Uncharacterized protein LOC112682535 isoform X2 n=1 Tax=Sipha flava TaxID=143950 RepID=A0A8B8FEQ3_9HEMI|nr:uncharacterized protein LOC112682535 isoform X2 [Sipha flava]
MTTEADLLIKILQREICRRAENVTSTFKNLKGNKNNKLLLKKKKKKKPSKEIALANDTVLPKKVKKCKHPSVSYVDTDDILHEKIDTHGICEKPFQCSSVSNIHQTKNCPVYNGSLGNRKR